MSDGHHPTEEVGRDCPDFEILSRFADDELETARADGVAAHLAACVRCGALAERLRDGFGAGNPLRGGGVGGSGCVGEERLVLYASAGAAADERADIAAHVGGCDVCVAALRRVRDRLRVHVEAPMPVPAVVQRRAEAVLAAAARELAGEATPARSAQAAGHLAGQGVFERLRGWLRVPVLIPAAAMGAALLLVSLGRLPTTGPAGTENSRALPPASARLRVKVSEALVYSRPSGQSPVVATVRHGALLDVAGEERGWYEVRLDGGQSGWIVREAFE